MRTLSTSGTRLLLIAATMTFAPAGAALAGQGCPGDPFGAYQRAFHPDGAYQCAHAAQEPGVQGRAGPDMSFDNAPGHEKGAGAPMDEGNERRGAASDDAFAGFRSVFIGD